MSVIRKFLPGFFLLSLIPQTVSANGLTPPVIGGNFASTVELNPSAVYWNPGTLGQLRTTQIFFNFSPTYFQSSYVKPGVYPEQSMSFLSPAFLLGASSNFGLKQMTFALGIYPSFGGETHWKADSPQRYQGTETNIMSVNITPAMSWSILPNLSIGAGGSYMINTLDAKMSMDMYNDITALGMGELLECRAPEDPGCEIRIDLKSSQGFPPHTERLSLGWNADVF